MIARQRGSLRCQLRAQGRGGHGPHISAPEGGCPLALPSLASPQRRRWPDAEAPRACLQFAEIRRLNELTAVGALAVAKKHAEQILPVAIERLGKFVWVSEHKANRYFELLAAAMRT